MGTYSVVITPEDAGGAEAIVRIDIDQGTARVVEFIVRPAANGTAFDEQLSAVFGLLLQAAQPAIAAVDALHDAGPSEQPTRTTAAPPRRSGSTRQARSNKPKTPITMDARAYRRMPDDLAERFTEIGSVTGLANHYGVPRHTAQGWLNRLRKGVA